MEDEILGLEQNIADTELLELNWPNLNELDFKNLCDDFDLDDPEKIRFLKDAPIENIVNPQEPLDKAATGNKRNYSNFNNVNQVNEVYNDGVNNSNIYVTDPNLIGIGNKKFKDTLTQSDKSPLNLPINISPMPQNNVSKGVTDTLSFVTIPSKIITTHSGSPIITNSSTTQSPQAVSLPGTTLLQISPAQQVQPQIVKRVVTQNSSSVPQVLQSSSALIQHVVLPDSNTVTTPPATVLYKAPTLATISTPIQGVDTAIVTGIPFVLDSDKVPVARIVGSNINNLNYNSFPKEKKSSHNEIEKRYRCSINDKILELKNLVAGEEAKLHKSQILKKAIDYIKYLLSQNARLRTELNSYRIKDNKKKSEFGIETPPYSANTPSPQNPYSSNTPSPQNSPSYEVSHPSSPESFRNDSPKETSPNSSPPYTANGMSDRSRSLFCIVMFAVVALNPIGMFTKSDNSLMWNDETDGKSGRTLMNIEVEASTNFVSSSAFVWLMNTLVFVMFLVKVFIYGEPSLGRESSLLGIFKKFIIQGDADMLKGNYNSASQKYREALIAVGHPLPVSFSERLLALLWQVFRQILQRLIVGKWLAKNAGGFFIEKHMRDEIEEVSGETLKTLHKLNKLHLMGHTDDSSHLLGLYLALYSLNLVECLNIDDCKKADILVTCALRARESLPSRWHLCARFLLAKTRRVCERVGEIPQSLQWLYSPKGQKFFVTHKWSYDAERKSLFSNFSDRANPVGYLLVLYREHLLEHAMRTLVNPGQKSDDVCENDLKRTSKTSDVLNYMDLLTDTYAGGNEDEVNQWWATVCKIAAHWLLGEEVDELFEYLDKIPKVLQTSTDTLPLAVLYAVRAKKDVDNLPSYTILRLCDQAGDNVAHSINISSCKEDDSILQYVQVLVCDWILDVRISIWECETTSDCDTLTVAPAHMLQGFQMDLAALRKLINVVPGVLQRVFLHEATMRMMAGASPAKTQLLLDRSLRHRYRAPSAICGKDKDLRNGGGEREHATALLMACRHLPSQLLSSPGERAGMLAEAAKTLEKIGDTKKMQDCYTLMRSMGSGVSTYC